jgi:hypothetical protein
MSGTTPTKILEIPQEVDVSQITHAREILNLQKKKNEEAISLIKQWLADESGYDETTWPLVKKSLEENRLSGRRRFRD